MDDLKLCGSIIVVKENLIHGKKEIFKADNIVSNDGDQFYAEAAMGSESWTPGFMRLGTDDTGQAKTDTDVNSFLAGTNQALDPGYPKTDDDDSDNVTSLDVVTWRTSYGTSAANVSSITEIAITDSGTSPAKSLCRAVFGSPFNKTSDDTLKVFINHTFNGV